MSLLFSQVGYEASGLLRVVYRAMDKATVLPRRATLISLATGQHYELAFSDWGQRWGSRWAVAEATGGFPCGVYSLAVDTGETATVEVGANLLWHKTFKTVAITQAEIRMRFCKSPPGWRDCGSWLQEVNSQAFYLLGMLDCLELAANRIDGSLRSRLLAQVDNGLRSLAVCQDAPAAGDCGALVHEINAQSEILIRNDAVKAALVFARAGKLLGKDEWTERAERAFSWAANAPPFNPETLEVIAHGAPVGYRPPDGAWQTVDLFMMAHAALVLADSDESSAADVRKWIGKGLERQVPPFRSEHGYYGHFYAFEDHVLTEKAWTHHGVSYDTGQCFNHWLFPLIEAYRRWPEDPEAARWLEALRAFAEGYLLPSSAANPFGICPLGVFEGEGLIEFAGLWHGMNTVYGYAAALAMDMAQLLPDISEELSAFATSNQQWIVGLNAGITRESLAGSHMFHRELAPGVAVPVSMIHGVGQQWAGSWTTINGSITNGFSVGDQFRFDVPARRADDGPHAFNDEEWITHAGGWLAALARTK